MFAKVRIAAVFVALASTTLAGCADTPAGASTKANTIVDVASAAGSFTTLVGALKSTGLDTTLSGAGPFTVFAPTDAAFALLPAGLLASLDKATLSTILTYHVYAGRALAADVVGLPSVKTVQGESIAIAVAGGGVSLNAWAAVTTTDIVADNGIIHVIDAVMLPPSIEFPGTMVDALKASPSYSTLVGAVVSASLAQTLSGDNDMKGFTLLAPTNAAFAALGIDLATLDTATLTSILLRHVASGEVPDTEVVKLAAVPTLGGADISVSTAGGGVRLGGKANVIRTNLRTTNGIIHAIDGVLTP